MAWIAIAAAVFPVLWVISAAFTEDPSISSSSIIPTSPTLSNFQTLFSNPDQPYANWYVNTMIVASVSAFFTVLIAAGAAYAFSRFRFTGRKVGIMFLLLVQMFPQFLALTAIYIIMVNIGDVFPPIGLDTLAGLTLVYLGGAMGVNAWLIKGFFDTIPMEIDESAKVDGATHGQVFWGIILPLAVPGPGGRRTAELHRHDQRVHHRQRADPDTRDQDPGGRPAGVHRQRVLGELGTVRRRRSARGNPRRDPLPVPAEVHRRRPDGGFGEGVVVPTVTHVHHDGSPLYVSTLSPRLGETLTLRLRTQRGQQPETVALRTVRDGEPHVVMAEAKETVGEDVWWVAQVTVRNVETHYRWLLVGGAFDFAWLTAGGLVDHDVPDATDFVISATDAAARVDVRVRRLPGLPRPLRPRLRIRARAGHRAGGSAAPRRGPCRGPGPTPPRAGARTRPASSSAATSTACAITSTTSLRSTPTCST